MSANEQVSRRMRLVEMFPVLAALALHAHTLDRAPVAVPAALLLLFCAFRRIVTENTTLRLFVVGIAGALVGGLMMLWREPPPGPVPPAVLSVICGVLLALAVSGIVSRSILYSWIYGWLLAILSLHVQPSPAVLVGVAILAGGTLVAAVVRSGILKGDRASLAGGALFLALVVGGTAGLSRGVAASEGFLMQLIGGTLMSLLNPAAFGGVALQDSITIGPRGSVERSATPLFELSGAVPTRVRTSVMDRFDGFNWSSSAAALRHVPGPDGSQSGPVRRITYTPLENLGAVVPVPAGTRLVEGANTWFLGGNVVRTDAGEPRALSFTSDATGWLLPEPAPGPDLLFVPPNLAAELAPFVPEVVPAEGAMRRRAGAAEAYFQAHFEYSLETDLVGKSHPLVTLLRERRPAYCIYFASAMAAVLRMSGIPARVVGGFVADEQNPITNDIVVRTRDAHAWVEAYLADEGRWETYDPTPSRSREALLENGRPGWISAVFSAIASTVRRSWKAFLRDPAAFLLHSVLAWIVVLGGLGWLAWQRRPGRRAAGPRGAQAVTDKALERAYQRYLKALAHAELAAGAAETDEELLARVEASRGGAAAGTARAFVERYREARFRTGQGDAESLGAALEAVERAFGKSA